MSDLGFFPNLKSQIRNQKFRFTWKKALRFSFHITDNSNKKLSYA
jgi:hypothetical protein